MDSTVTLGLAIASLWATLAHVSMEVTRLVRGDDSLPGFSWMTGIALGAGALAFIGCVEPAVPWAHVLLTAAAVAAFAAGQLSTFTLSFVAAQYILVWIQIAHRSGRFVLYDARTSEFTLTRSTLYASIRAATAFAGARSPIIFPIHARLLVPFALAAAESVGMLFFGWSGSYEMSYRHFVIYNGIKLAVFLVLPLLEEAVNT